jgi:hypothetical protein
VCHDQNAFNVAGTNTSTLLQGAGSAERIWTKSWQAGRFSSFFLGDLRTIGLETN